MVVTSKTKKTSPRAKPGKAAKAKAKSAPRPAAKKSPSKPKPVAKAQRSAKAPVAAKTARALKPAAVKGPAAKTPVARATSKRTPPSRPEVSARQPSRPVAPQPPVARRPPVDHQRAVKAFELGLESFYRKDFKRAVEAFRAIVANYPHESEILDRAQTYLRICEKSSQQKPSRPQTADDHYKLGILRYNEGDLDAAVELFAKALTLDARNDKVHYVLAAAHALRGEGDEALKALKRAIEINPDNRIFAANDGDFELLRERGEFKSLVDHAAAPPAGGPA